MGYKLGSKSRSELKGVHEDMVKVVERAIRLTKQDFTVHDGIRTVAEQKRYVARGVSKTMNSKHLRQKDGYGHAVDNVPYINGKLRWEWEPIYEIAYAMNVAARELGVALRWGGCWDVRFDDIELKSAAGAKRLVDQYVARRRARGRRAFIDGPHFELHKDHFKKR
jgi:peptidoglycan L-alanyl-D-glutamate endopeptidase CwlK